MKYLKRFNEELTPEVYKRASKGILDRQKKDAEVRKKLGMIAPSEEEEEDAKKRAEELEKFAKEREKNYDGQNKIYSLNKKAK